MNNFPTGSFLLIKLPHQILFVRKLRKTRTTARINLLLNIYKQIDYLNCLKDLTGLNAILFTCVQKISNHFIDFSLRNSKNIKNNTFSQSKSFVFLFFIGENIREYSVLQKNFLG